MTKEDAKEALIGLRERYGNPYSAEDKASIEQLYRVVMGRAFRATSCQNCYHDAVIEMYLQLKRHDTMISEHSYFLQAGYIIHSPLFHDGKIFTNENLTDEVAEEYIKQFPNVAKFVHRVREKVEVDNIPQPKRKRNRTQKKKQKTEE